MSESAPRLCIENICKVRRAPDGGEVEILKGVSCKAWPGQILAVVGPSGGGKSTLVRLLNRLEDPSSGRILLEGEDVNTLDPLSLRRRVGLVQQKPCMFDGTVLHNLQLPFFFRGEPLPGAGDPTFLETLELCRLDPKCLDQEASSLSLGQQQRLSLARILISRPEVLLLDEPTSALDRPTGDRLAATLREICRSGNLALIMVTHDLRLAERVADRAAYLEGGRILEEGPAGEVFSNPRSEAFRKFLMTPEETEARG
jgi:putative ABC transport system ATP-binding protein